MKSGRDREDKMLYWKENERKNMIILFGAAGSGKSTQGRILAQKFGWRWLSVGEVLRGTGEFDETLKAGGLVDDDTVIMLMKKEMDRAEMEGLNVVLDGYPRDTYQAEWLCKEMPEKIEGAIILELPKKEIWRRIELRGRSDDTEEVLARRLEIFEKHIEAIVPMLERVGVKIERVSGVGSVEEVTERVAKLAAEWTGERMEAGEEDLEDGMTREKSYGE